MSNLSTSKSILAKLLATENVTVEHGNFQTASFDVKNRILRLPIWKTMSGSLYDLMVLHEVGHALYTPEEGWHDSMSNRGAGFKSYLNVIEDARIERKIKDKYPGGRRSFIDGYLQLVKQDMFGIQNIEPNDLHLIDRINLHFKGGSLYDINFTDEEMVFVNRASKTVTWNDVVKLSEDLYDYSKQNEDGDEYYTDYSDHDFSKKENSEFDVDDSYVEGSKSTGASGKNSQTDETDEKESNEQSENFDDAASESVFEDGKSTEGGQSGSSNPDPKSVTDQNFRERENELVEDADSEIIYAYFPDADTSKIVVDYKVLHNTMLEHYSCFRDHNLLKTKARSLFKEFQDKNKKVIEYLVKEFEMKKAAESHARTRTANTGIIDSSALHSYKYTDSIFKKMNIVEDGKSHGLVMVVDWSGSMHNNIVGTIEQMMTLVMFCKRVGIPFEVYLFSDQYPQTDVSDGYRNGSVYRWPHKTIRKGDIIIDPFRLLNVFSSRMKKMEFNLAVENMFSILNSMNPDNYYTNNILIPSPVFMDLGGTPLNQSLMAMGNLVPEFKTANGVDIVNLIYLTDGDGYDGLGYWSVDSKDDYSKNDYESTNSVNPYLFSTKFSTKSVKCFVTDRETKKQYTYTPNRYNRSASFTSMILHYLRDKYNINVVNFYIKTRNFHQNEIYSYTENYDEIDKLKKSWRDSGHILLKDTCGWSSLYMIKGGSHLATNDSQMSVQENATKSQLRKAFSRMNKSKLQNRVILTNFVDMVA